MEALARSFSPFADRRGWRRVAWLVLLVAFAASVLLLAGRRDDSAFLTTGFEDSALEGWDVKQEGAQALVRTQTDVARSGDRALMLRAGPGASFAYARRILPSAQPQLTATAWVYVDEEGPAGANVPLIRLFDPNGQRSVSVYRQNHTRDRVWIEHSGRYRQTGGTVPLDRWMRVELSLAAWGRASSTLELRIGDRSAYRSTTASLPPVLAIQFGNEQREQPFALAVDDVSIDLGAGDTAAPDTTVLRGPAARSATGRARFELRASEPDSAFSCRLDGGDWITCTDPREYFSLLPGRHRFEARATDPAGNTDATPAVHEWTVLKSSEPQVLVGAGEIADCAGHGDQLTADVVPPDAQVFTTGDNAFQDADPAALRTCYDPSWGSFRERTRPALGPGDYGADGPREYFDYFGPQAGDPARGYYSYDLGAWHVIVLNSNCSRVGGCGVGSEQERWLRRDLVAHGAACTLAYWHHPLFSSSAERGVAAMRPFWRALYEKGADVVVAGRDRFYERFAPQDPLGRRDARHGLRQFTVGTGGVPLERVGRRARLSEVREDDALGVLRLELGEGRYAWRFDGVAGSGVDSGSARCHMDPVATRPGAVEGDFDDDFERGDLSAWSSVHTGPGGAAVVQPATVHDGRAALRLSASSARGSFAFARTAFSSGRRALELSGAFYLQAEGPKRGNVPLFRVFDDRGRRLASVYRQNQSFDQIWVAAGGRELRTSGVLPLGTWVQLKVKLTIDGARSRLIVESDGAPVFERADLDLGTRGVLAFQVGNDSRRQPFDLVVDDVQAR